MACRCGVKAMNLFVLNKRILTLKCFFLSTKKEINVPLKLFRENIMVKIENAVQNHQSDLLVHSFITSCGSLA